ncbi:hypothetical protein amb3737 [Paramagnetospirillum magneticum AMB-1]|uniref:Uncharacterized protein n=1 Tax=Paramagnetospirillum magneticum (strain ATCC 700264 / AMB-1) TaxID=342108 RepID=Q2W0T4_PARM1|nr:hypothetical protein amb3737 [Paramagnetospirillum magneticum AMB-1]
MLPAILVKAARMRGPTISMPGMAMMEIRAAIRPYSMAVAPCSSRESLVIRVRMEVNIFYLLELCSGNSDFHHRFRSRVMGPDYVLFPALYLVRQNMPYHTNAVCEDSHRDISFISDDQFTF